MFVTSFGGGDIWWTLRRKGGHGVFASKTVWSMPEHFETMRSINGTIWILFLSFLLLWSSFNVTGLVMGSPYVTVICQWFGLMGREKQTLQWLSVLLRGAICRCYFTASSATHMAGKWASLLAMSSIRWMWYMALDLRFVHQSPPVLSFVSVNIVSSLK